MGGGLFFHGLLDTHQNLTLSRDTSLLYVDLNTDFFFCLVTLTGFLEPIARL